MSTIANGSTTSVTIPKGATLQTTGQGLLIYGPGAKNGQQRQLSGTESIASNQSDQLVYLQGVNGLTYSVSRDGTPSAPSPKIVPLTTDYVLRADDEGTIFYATTAVIVTVPELGAMPACLFVPPAAGSITMRPSGATTINGAQLDVIKSRSTDPNGFALAPLYGDSNAYTTTSGIGTYAALGGNPTDSTAFNTWAASVPTAAAKKSGNYTVLSTDNGAFIWLAAQATDKTFTLSGTGVPNNFRCRIGYLNNSSAAGRLILAASSASFNWCASATPGTLNTATTIYMGAASTTSIAVADVYYEGSAPGGSFFIVPVTGAMAAA